MELVPVMIFALNSLFNFATVNSEEVTEEPLSAVSSSAGSEKFYLEMKRLHSLQEPKYDNREDTQAICEAVLNSAHFFYYHEVRPLNPSDPWVRKQLKQNFSTIHNDLYPGTSFIQAIFGGKGKSNPYVERTISHLDENIQEHVITCVARRRRSEAIEIFFISYKYDFGCMTESEFRNNNGEKLVGRFVFEYKKGGRINLIALAENPVRVFSFTPRFRSLFRDSLMKDVRRNARCEHLTPSEKLRLCSVALNAEAYKGIIHFWSRKEDVKHQCENVNLTLYGMHGSVSGFEFENESVFKCRADFVGHSAQSAIFFISSGDERHKFFISGQEGNRTVIQKYFYSYNLGTHPQV